MTMVEADRAASAGDWARAIRLLEEAAAVEPANPEIWMKLAALQKRTGQPAKALRSVNQVLALAELDFVALMLRATLLEQLDPEQAGEAWSNALAQCPDTELPPHMQEVLAKGMQVRDRWLQAKEERLGAAAADAIAAADAEEAARIARFRTNIVRKTRTYHSEPTDFHFPGLREREFHPRSHHPWLATLEAAVDTITAELETVMQEERAELVPYIQYPDHLPLAQWRTLNNSPDWTAIHLLQNGAVVDANARYCPATLELLRGFPQPDVPGAGPNAMFSLLAPHAVIPPHVGVSNTRLVCHLPLIVPDGCWFRVGDEVRHWERGKAFVFDDSIEHEAANPTDQLRVVFIFDVWHPDLTDVEREAVRRIIGSETGVDNRL